jgi:hypothetical protein
LTRAVQQGRFGERAAFGSFVCEAGRFFLLGERSALLFSLLDRILYPEAWLVKSILSSERLWTSRPLQIY